MTQRFLNAVGAIALLAGCAAGGMQNTISGVEVALTAADQLALQYVTLPLCKSGGPTLCSQVTVSTQVKSAAQLAYTAVKDAEASGASADLTTAQAAVAKLSALVPAAPAS
jgi:hypothetical protein